MALRLIASCVLALLLVVPSTASAQSLPILYRIFLEGDDGLTSYGDYARVGDRVIFSLPVALRTAGIGYRTQLMSLPSSRVDWEMTERYAESARYAHYAETRGERDYAALSTDVAESLNALAQPGDPARQILTARATRERLVTWVRRHHGYREHDIREIVSLLDEAISGLAVVTGENSFHLSFVAVTQPRPRLPLRAEPTLQDIIVEVLTAARLTPVPAERLSALQTVIALLDRGGDASVLPREWARPTRRAAEAALEATLRDEHAYAALTRSSLGRAATRARSADVRGVRAVLARARERDAELEHARPNRMNALIDVLQRRIDDAQRLQLARDRWRLYVDLYRGYRRQIDEALDQFDRARDALEDIELLAGPDPDALDKAQRRLRAAAGGLGLTYPPAVLGAVHDLLKRSLALGLHAAELRRRAVSAEDLAAARNAAAAASGALMLFERATTQLHDALTFPELTL